LHSWSEESDHRGGRCTIGRKSTIKRPSGAKCENNLWAEDAVTVPGQRQVSEASASSMFELYLKLIDYKRSVGKTQWTILSLFLSASQIVLAIGATHAGDRGGRVLPVLGVSIYWLGFLLYRRYRHYNRQISAYLAELEGPLGLGFQAHLNRSVHARGMSTETILALGGLLYTAVAALMVFRADRYLWTV
jgi:hypothetical protein